MFKHLRRYVQFSLLTTFVMMLAASGWVYLNVRENYKVYYTSVGSLYREQGCPNRYSREFVYCWGRHSYFGIQVRIFNEQCFMQKYYPNRAVKSTRPFYHPDFGYIEPDGEIAYHKDRLAENVLLGIGMVFAFGVLFEIASNWIQTRCVLWGWRKMIPILPNPAP